METPLSSTKLSRSHALATSKSTHRSALFDITNDSPIVGLAMGNLSTPLSKKKRSVISSQCSDDDSCITPGSGEALLRNQVKNLLEKVKEEDEIMKFTLEDVGGPFAHLKGLIHNSPMCLLAPTPSNTPLVNGTQNLEKNGLVSGTSTPVLEQVSITKMVMEIIERQKKKEEDSLIKRSLFDFYQKSEAED